MKRLMVLILLVISMQIAYSKWEKCPGWKNEGYHIYTSMYVSNDIIYVVFNYNTILISKDEAESWETIKTSFTTITSLMVKDGNIWVTTNNGVFISKDEGKNWEEKNNGLTDLSVTAIEQLNGNILIATKGHIYVSEDNEESWEDRSNGLPNDLTVTLIKTNNGGIYLGTNTGLYYSSDVGKNWGNIGPKQNIVSTIIFTGDNLYAGIRTVYEDGGIYKTNDNGNNWAKLIGGSVNSILIVQDTIYYGSFYSGLYISTDDGKTWGRRKINNENEFMEAELGLSGNFPDVEQIVKVNDRIIAGTQNGMFYSTNNGVTWLTSIPRENYGGASYLYVNKGNLYVATLYPAYIGGYLHIGNVLVSTNQGKTWTKISKDPLIYRVRAIAVSGDTIFAGTDGYGLYYTTNGGETWIGNKITDSNITTQNQITSINTIFSMVIKDNNIILGTKGRIYLSKNRGITWERWYPNGGGYTIYSVVNKGEEYFASTAFQYQKAVFKANGIGNDWIDLSNKFNIPYQQGNTTGGDIPQLIVENQAIYALIEYSEIDGVYITNDDGESWERKVSDVNGYGNGWNDMSNPLSLAVKGNNIFVGTLQIGIFVSTDNGESWSEPKGNKNNGFPPFHTDNGFAGYQIRSIEVINDYVFAGLIGGYDNRYESGLYRIKLDDITDIKEQREELTKYHLFPNPAYSTTRVKLQQEGQVAITAVDLLGRSFPLWSGYASTGDMEIDVSNLPIGSYTLLIDYGTKREAVRMMKE